MASKLPSPSWRRGGGAAGDRNVPAGPKFMMEEVAAPDAPMVLGWCRLVVDERFLMCGLTRSVMGCFSFNVIAKGSIRYQVADSWNLWWVVKTLFLCQTWMSRCCNWMFLIFCNAIGIGVFGSSNSKKINYMTWIFYEKEILYVCGYTIKYFSCIKTLCRT
jgi:hypothetical protein